MAIKGQALANFIEEFTYVNTTKLAGMTSNAEVSKVDETRNGETSAVRQEDME